MKKLLIPLLVSSMFANAQVVTGVGEYRYGPDTSEESACIIAEQMAKEDAIAKVVGEEVATVSFEQCENENCVLQKDTIVDRKGYIKELLHNEVATNKGIGFHSCTASIRADVQMDENPIQLKLYNTDYRYSEGDEIIIKGFVDRPGTLLIYTYSNGIYSLVYGEKFAQYNYDFVLPSTQNRMVALLPDGELTSKELMMVLFTNSNRDFRLKYNKAEMETLLNSIPFEKRKVINNYIYIMKRGNTL